MQVTMVALNSKYIHSNLALRYLESFFKGYAKEDVREGVSITLIEETVNDEIGSILERIMDTKPDLVLFSAYIWNYSDVLLLSEDIKKIDKRILIASGGPEVSFLSGDHVLESNIDIVLRGEGEETFLELVSALYQNFDISSLKGIKGLTYRENDTIHEEEDRSLMDMNKLIFPYTEESIDGLKNRIVYYEGSRGCPFQCTYCMSSLDKKVRTLHASRVMEELKKFMIWKVPLVKFVDRTFNADKAFATKIWKFIIDERKKNKDFITAFHFEVAASLLTEDQIEILREADKNLIQFEAGVQTTDRSILLNVKRYDDFRSIKEKLSKIIAFDNIHIHTDLIAGLPNDTLDSFIKSFNDCMEIRAQMLQLGFLKVLKGTDIYKETQKWGIEYFSREPYEVLKTNTMSYEDLRFLKKIDEVCDKYWNSGSYKYTMNVLLDKYIENKMELESFGLFSELAKELNTFRKNNKANPSKDDWGLIILKLNQRLELLDEEILKDILRFDYITHDRKGNIPKYIENEYKTLKVTLCLPQVDTVSLKGSVNSFKINVWDLKKRKVVTHKNMYLWYALSVDDMYEVEPLGVTPKSFRVISDGDRR